MKPGIIIDGFVVAGKVIHCYAVTVRERFSEKGFGNWSCKEESNPVINIPILKILNRNADERDREREMDKIRVVDGRNGIAVVEMKKT